jgi:hypothetical protein
LTARPPAFGERRALSEEALAQLPQLRAALATYDTSGRPEDLDRAFAVARALVAALPGAVEWTRPDLEELRWLARAIPEFGALLSTAAVEAERAISAGLFELWLALELRSEPPGWTPHELEAARMLFACTCAASSTGAAERVPAGLRGLAAGRLAQRLAGELAGEEGVWQRALGPRYESLRHRYAPRTAWRSRGLSELLRTDDDTRRAVCARLERWLASGGRLAALAAELEAALVHERTPAKFA